MSSLRTWFRGSAPHKASREPSPAVSASTSTTGLSDGAASSAAAREVADMEDAMASTALLLNDDIDGAEARLRARKGSSVFHLMGLGVATFMRSVLGFEKETMNEANTRLLECEARAWEAMKKAQAGAAGAAGAAAGGSAGASGSIYPPGSEYALVHAETQIMLAVVAELHESLTEAIRGFYKLRKAFVSLSAIIESEEAFLRGDAAGAARLASRPGTAKRLSFSEDAMPGAFDEAEFADLEAEAAAEAKAPAPALSEKTAALSLDGGGSPAPAADVRTRNKRHLDTLSNPVDVFVHSGANLCFGLLLMLISMVPPAFSRLLSIVGFKGDRERGVRMLWQSTKFPNVYGGLAGLVLLVYYNSLMASADIHPSDADIAALTDNGGKDSSEMEIVGYPRDRCRALLAHMRALFPDSLLWVLEEARLLAADRRVGEALAVLQAGGGHDGGDGKPRVAKMQQITALTKFELAVDAMAAMEWAVMRDAFLACVELNTWSHALYYYCAGCAELELYRTAFHAARALRAQGRAGEAETAAARAARHKKAAEAHLRTAPTKAGRKKFMARQMPFDVFVLRKLARWEERARRHGIDLADAVGASPALEMGYLWGSVQKLPDALLAQALDTYAAWERCTADAAVVAAFRAAPDESGIASLCRAALLRGLGRLDAAQAVLEQELLVHDRAAFKGPARDDYVLAAAHYEAAVVLWLRASDRRFFPAGADAAAVDAYRRGQVDACLAQLDKVARWEAFVLDARIGMKVQTGLDTVRWLKGKKGW